jgi:hypothetical protein
LNARSIAIRSLIFGFALTAAAQVWIELPFNSAQPNFLSRVAFVILTPGQLIMSAATLGMLNEDDLWAALLVNVLIWAAALLVILLIIKRLERKSQISNVRSATQDRI